MSKIPLQPEDPAKIAELQKKTWHKWLDQRALQYAEKDYAALIVPFGTMITMISFFVWGSFVPQLGLGEPSSIERVLWLFSVPTVIGIGFLIVGKQLCDRSMIKYRASYKRARQGVYAFYREPLDE